LRPNWLSVSPSALAGLRRFVPAPQLTSCASRSTFRMAMAVHFETTPPGDFQVARFAGGLLQLLQGIGEIDS
jgi:hypothetical protein